MTSHNLLCRKFAAVCRKIVTSCPTCFLNPRRRWPHLLLSCPDLQLENMSASADMLCGRPHSYRPTMHCATLTWPLTVWAENWHTVTPALGNVRTNFGFSAPFCFRVRRLSETDGRTYRQTSKTCTAACYDGLTLSARLMACFAMHHLNLGIPILGRTSFSDFISFR